MSWLRVDDGFTKHPKFEGWPPAQRWAWLEVMEYCARYNTRGRIPTDITLLPRSVTVALLKKAEAAGWCSREDDGALWINDWEEFNPPRQTESELDELVKEAVGSHPTASANDLVKLVSGNRKAVLASIRRVRQTAAPSEAGGSEGGSQVGSQLVPDVEAGTSSRTGSRTGSRAGARGRPVPSPTPEEETLAVDVAEETSRLDLVDAIASADEQQTTEQDNESTFPDFATVLKDVPA